MRQPMEPSFDELVGHTLRIVQEAKAQNLSFLPRSIPPVSKKVAPVEKKEPMQKEALPSPKETVSSLPLPQKEPVEKNANFTLHPPTPALKTSIADIKTTVEKIAPQLKLNFNIPNDSQAKLVKTKGLDGSSIPDVPILGLDDQNFSFLENIAKAIDLHFFPSKAIKLSLLEKLNAWDRFLSHPHLKLILITDSALWGCKNLLPLYQEIPRKKERYLGKVPLLLLSDPALYMKDPSLKRSLWQILCHHLKSQTK